MHGLLVGHIPSIHFALENTLNFTNHILQHTDFRVLNPLIICSISIKMNKFNITLSFIVDVEQIHIELILCQ